MNGMMTRNKAAEQLGVTPQTITNWCKRGLLGHCYDEHKMLHVNAGDIERHAKKYRMLDTSERMLDNRLRELSEERHRTDEELTQLRRTIVRPSNGIATTEEVMGLISCLYENLMIPGMKGREMSMMRDFIAEGHTLNEMAEKYHLSRDRVRQIIAKGCRRVTENIEEIMENISENERLRKLIVMQGEEIEGQRNELEVCYAMSEEMKKRRDADKAWKSIHNVVDINFEELRLTTRTLNILRCHNPSMRTLFDLLTTVGSVWDFKKDRNCGKKSMCELDFYLRERGLFFKRPSESKEDFIIRLSRSLNKNENENEEKD